MKTKTLSFSHFQFLLTVEGQGTRACNSRQLMDYAQSQRHLSDETVDQLEALSQLADHTNFKTHELRVNFAKDETLTFSRVRKNVKPDGFAIFL